MPSDPSMPYTYVRPHIRAPIEYDTLVDTFVSDIDSTESGSNSSDSIVPYDVNINLTEILMALIKQYYDTSNKSATVINKIKVYSVSILELIAPLLNENEEIVITLKCSKDSIQLS